MKRLAILSFLSLIILSGFYGCGSSDSDSGIIIQGEVTDNTTGSPIAGATVVIESPEELRRSTDTDTAGVYRFSGIDLSEPVNIQIAASSVGYITSTEVIENASPTRVDPYDVNFELDEEEEDTGGGGDSGSGDDDIIVEGEPGIPSAIVLNSISETDINIRQTGGNVSSVFSFVVQDSSGRNMDQNSPVTVNFRILNGPDGGETVVPSSAETNADGIVATSLFSGDSAGVVRIEAFFEREDGARISSSPIIIAVNGGFPDPDRFFVAPENRNLEGFGLIAPSIEYEITASVGDAFGNPVRVGTSVDFRSLEAGIINGSAQTNGNGFASVSFFPNGSEPNTNPNGIGFFTVEAHTIDGDNQDINAEVLLLFTTRRANITFADATFDVISNGSDVVSFTVTDENGYPMAAGTTIVSTSSPTIGLTGDSNVTLGDHFVGGPGITEFTVTLNDLDDESATQVATTLTVTVTTPSGAETSLTLAGTRAKISGQ